MSTVVIIGAGMMGMAMGRPASDNGHEIRLVGTPLDDVIIDSIRKNSYHPTLQRVSPENMKTYYAGDLVPALENADLVIGGISSFGVDWFAETVLPKLSPGAKVLLVTKGLRNYPDGRLEPFPLYFETLRPDVEFLAIGGPCICFELMDRRHTLIYCCGKSMDTLKQVRKLLATKYYHITPTVDVIGVECGAALKNAYALGVALSVGLAEQEKGLTDASGIGETCVPGAPDFNPVYNPQAALFGQSCIEMRRLVTMQGGNPNLVSGLPGAGDLYVTVFGGRTRRLGTLLGRGLPYSEARKVLNGITLESTAIISGVAAALRIRAAQGKVDLREFPLLMYLDAIINQEVPVELDWDSFGE